MQERLLNGQLIDINFGRFRFLFEKLKTISTTEHSEVFEVKNKIDSNKYAVKKIAYEDDLSRNNALKEVQILLQLQSNYVVQYVDHWVECDHYMYIKLEYYPNTLKEVLELKARDLRRDSDENISPIDYYISCELFRQLLEGLDYLHRSNIIHRKLSPEKVMVSTDLRQNFLKICDFCSAVSINGVNYSQVGDIVSANKYTAPEVMRNVGYDALSDIYSLGVMAEIDLFNIDFQQQISFSIPGFPNQKIGYLFENVIPMQTTPKWRNRPKAIDILKNFNQFSLTIEEVLKVQINNEFKQQNNKFIHDFIEQRLLN